MRYLRLLLLLSFNVALLNAHERITSFISDIVINKDATLRVQESIEVVSENKTILHGIVREFPTSYRDTCGTRYIVDFKILSVTHDGHAVPFHIESVSNGKKIYIGYKNSFVKPGKHLYVITYETNRQLGFFNDHDEIYWNVTGTGWRLPIDEVQAHVYLPQGISEQLIKAEAYTGYQGEQGKNYSYTIQDNCVLFTTNHELKQFEGLTIVTTFPKGFVTEPSWYQNILWNIRDNKGIVLICIILLYLLMILISGFITVKRINKPGIIIPLFYPPVGMMPCDVGYINRMKFNNILLSADIIDLAVHDFITITYKPKMFFGGTYILKIKNRIPCIKTGSIINEYHESLISTLFGKNKSITISNEYNPKINKALELCKKHTKKYDESDITTIPIFSYTSMLMCLLIFCSMIFFLNNSIIIKEFIIPTVMIIVFFKFFTDRLSNVYTPAGRKKQDAIDGFKLYLTTAEIERMNMIGTPPTKTPELYEKYLPYAIALGLEKQWTAQFSILFKEFGDSYKPLWYHGQTFRSNNFGSKFTNSFSSTIASSSTRPGKSSGSSGKGRSGGGGGGGGGGGW